MGNNRIEYEINDGWKFTRGNPPKAWYKGFEDDGWKDVTLPHDWSVSEDFSKDNSSGTGYLSTGLGFYRKKFTLPEGSKGKTVILRFNGVYNNSMVWVNTNYLGKRPYGYSSFSYDISEFVSADSENVICVKVDHRYSADSRWFTGSGIYRDVFITVVDPLHVAENGVFVTTPQITNTSANVHASIQIKNDSATAKDAQITTAIIDKNGNEVTSCTREFSIASHGDYTALSDLIVTNPKLWSPESPDLYKLKTVITCAQTVTDELETVFGIRSFAFDGDTGFYLNGVNQKLRGVCIHHDAGCLGAAVDPVVWERRFRKFKEAGCNAIRTSHNPPDPKLLDLCDTMGFLVMDEAFDEWEMPKNKWWQGHNVYPPKNDGYYEDFPEWSERDLKDLIIRDRNHPSIIIWSIGNEIDYPNDPYCHPLFGSMTGNNDAHKPKSERLYDPDRPNAVHLAKIARRLTSYVKELDTTRPVTAALAFPELSNHTGYADALDIVGYNYKEHMYKDDHATYPGRVIYGSENSTDVNAWVAVRDNDFICGQFLWTGIDFLGEAQGWPIRVSQAGIMTTAGFEKPGFYLRKCLWTDTPTVFAAIGEDFHDAKSHWNWEDGEKLPVLCFSNCEQIELFVNDVSVGKKLTENCVANFEVTYSSGSLKAVGTSADGTKAEYILQTAGAATQVLTHEYESDSDIVQIEVTVTDDAFVPVAHVDTVVQVSVSGGVLMGIENGDPADLEPYYLNYRKTHYGRLIVFVKKQTPSAKIEISLGSK